MDKRRRRGKWGSGYTAKSIGLLMGGLSPTRVKQKLYPLRDELGRMPNDDEIGNLIYEYRRDKIYAKVKRFLA